MKTKKKKFQASDSKNDGSKFIKEYIENKYSIMDYSVIKDLSKQVSCISNDKTAIRIYALAMMNKDVNEDEMLKEEPMDKLSVKLTKSAIKLITTETKKEYSVVISLPPAPYTKLQPAMKLHKMSRRELCSYIADKIPRINAVSGFATCNPSIATIEALYELLLPLANMNVYDMNFEQKTNMKQYEEQLSTNFAVTINSCVTLSNGSLPMFTLTGVAQKRKSTKNKNRLAAPYFKMDTKKGPGTIKLLVMGKIPYAKMYIVYYGVGEYDKSTWKSVVGNSRILLTDLEKGARLYFIMAAIGATGEGSWSEPQTTTVPSN